MKNKILVLICMFFVSNESFGASYITEIFNQTNYMLRLYYQQRRPDLIVVKSTMLNNDDEPLATYSDERGIYVQAHSRTSFSGAFIPFEDSDPSETYIRICLIDYEDNEDIQPVVCMWQEGINIYGKDRYIEGSPMFKLPVFGNHAFSLIFKQTSDDFLYRSEKTDLRYAHALDITLVLNSDIPQ